MVAALRADTGHAINVVREAIPGRPETFRYTCFQFAFGLVNPHPDLTRIATRHDDVFPGSDFVTFLVASVLTEIKPETAEDDDIVIYFRDGVPQHAGLISADLVVSKWGMAHTWRHRLFEVPSSYGSSVRYLALPRFRRHLLIPDIQGGEVIYGTRASVV